MDEEKAKRHATREIVRMIASKYDPAERITVFGPFQGIVVLPDGFIARFDYEGKAAIPRKSLGAANAIGCRRRQNWKASQ
jgi:hypothetical protein